MKTKLALIATVVLVAAFGSVTVAPRLSAQRNDTGPGAARPGTRCTRLAYPSLKDAAYYRKNAVLPDGTTSGTRCTRLWGTHPARVKVLPNDPPFVDVLAALDDVVVNRNSDGTVCLTRTGGVKLAASARDPEGDQMLYTWSTTGGRLTGDGANVEWDLSGVQPGTYTTTVEVDDGCGCIAFSSASLPVK